MFARENRYKKNVTAILHKKMLLITNCNETIQFANDNM